MQVRDVCIYFYKWGKYTYGDMLLSIWDEFNMNLLLTQMACSRNACSFCFIHHVCVLCIFERFCVLLCERYFILPCLKAKMSWILVNFECFNWPNATPKFSIKNYFKHFTEYLCVYSRKFSQKIISTDRRQSWRIGNFHNSTMMPITIL